MKNFVLTCGPASEDDRLLHLIAGVATGLRLNIAHLTRERLVAWLDRLQRLREVAGRRFRIILDLQGAKVRIGRFPDTRVLPDRVELFYGESSDCIERIPVPNSSVFAQTSPGDLLLMNDRRVTVRITDKSETSLYGAIENNGPLSSGKGLNSPDRVFEMARVTASDAAAIELSRNICDLDYAVSFVSDGREEQLFRPLTGDNHRLIAKIEQRAAFDHLKAISGCFDELWLCRGDLGSEAGLRHLGAWQQKFVEMIPALDCPSLLAGEVLGSMVLMPQPSRAEIVQLYDAMHSGFAGLVLSDETACGTQIPAVVDFLRFFFADADA